MQQIEYIKKVMLDSSRKSFNKIGRKALATALVTSVTLGQIVMPILAKENDEKEHEVILQSKEACVLTSDNTKAKFGDKVKVYVDYEPTFDFQGVELKGKESGSNIEYSHTDADMSFIMPNESVVASVIGFDRASEINIKELEPVLERSMQFQSLEQYVLDNASKEYLEEIAKTADVAQYISTMQTMATKSDFTENHHV